MAKVPVVPPRSGKFIEDRANELAQRYDDFWAGRMPCPLDCIFELDLEQDLGIKALYTGLSPLGVGVLGYTDGEKKISCIDKDVADDTSMSGRRFFRSTVGHELGHCYLHADLRNWQASLQMSGMGLKRERETLKPYEDPEWQAWRYGLALSMPAHLVSAMVARYGLGKAGIDALVKHFDMNPAYVHSRLRSLKMMPH